MKYTDRMKGLWMAHTKARGSPSPSLGFGLLDGIETRLVTHHISVKDLEVI